ncbi:MAG: 23S rRNA (guanosine(2251)-2'-O)-methyltransferase RlmB [Candidatus Binatia bacterium]
MVVKRRNLANRDTAVAAQERHIYGVHPVTAWLRSRPDAVRAISYDPRVGQRLAEVLHLAQSAGIATYPRGDRALAAMAGTGRHQGVVAVCQPFPYADLQTLVEAAPPLFVVADQLQDPHNLGALLRTAEAVGAGGVILPKDGAAGVTAAVEIAAAGATALVPVCRVTNLVRTMRALKRAGYWSVGLVPKALLSLYEADLPARVAVVVGGEAGMRPLVARECDFAVAIPMQGRIDSLNASVAAAVTLYELLRRSTRGCPGERYSQGLP